MLSLNKVYKRNEDFICRKIASEVILIPIKADAVKGNVIYVLNKTSAFIWDLLDGEKSLREIKQVLTTKFEVSNERAEKDLLEFIKEMEKLGGVSPL